MAAKHAHKRQITEFKYGGCIRLSMGKFLKSDTVIMWKSVLKMPTSEMYYKSVKITHPCSETLTYSLRSAPDEES